MLKPSSNTVFVVGNGPSLKGVNLSRVSQYTWVGMNAAYRHWHQVDIYPDYYACLDLIVGASHYEAIIELVENSEHYGIKKFLLRNNIIRQYEVLSASSKVVNFDKSFADLPDRVLNLVTTGSHSALWMADMGFDEILLLGVDANYTENLPGRKNLKHNKLLIQSSTDNPNYYFDSYQSVGDAYTVPNPLPKVHIGAWRRVSQYLEETSQGDIKIYNGSRMSLLDSIQFFDLESFFLGTRKLKSVEAHFDDLGKASLRRFSSPHTISVEVFMDRITPPRLNKFVTAVENTTDSLSKMLKRKGWRQVKKGAAIESSTIMFTDPSHLAERSSGQASDGVVILGPLPKNRAVDVLKTLNKVYDTVLLFYHSNGTHVLKYPCDVPDIDSYVVAFETIRFWDKEIITALSKPTFVKQMSVRFKRRAYRVWQALR